MSAAAIGGYTAAAEYQTEGVNAFADMDSSDFIRVLMTELSNQDPLAPNDTAKLLEQLSSLRNIESQSTLEDTLKSLVLQNGVIQASGMIGKLVQGLSVNGSQISGLVTSVRVVDGAAQLELDSGVSLPLENVQLITPAPTE
ncbi:MAG: hypothetical protein IT445_12450 [Phycisphaeraceae bacterium]|nr:hypothetical protein [Phycisphaeraceae bacterium]